jgi:anti-sigma factor RsiW
MSSHVTAESLLEFLDGTLPASGRERVEEHIRTCHACARVLNDFKTLEQSIRKTPVVQTSRGFTGVVMSRILDAKEPFTFRLLTGMAYAFAMMIVLVVLGVVFLAAGVVDVQNGGEPNRFQEIFSATSSTLAEVPSAMTGWITEYIPFVFGTGSIGITAAILVVVSMIFVFDRFVGSRIVGRLR